MTLRSRSFSVFSPSLEGLNTGGFTASEGMDPNLIGKIIRKKSVNDWTTIDTRLPGDCFMVLRSLPKVGVLVEV